MQRTKLSPSASRRSRAPTQRVRRGTGMAAAGAQIAAFGTGGDRDLTVVFSKVYICHGSQHTCLI